MVLGKRLPWSRLDAQAAVGRPSGRLTVLILAAGCFVSGLNVNMLSPLIPHIGRSFGVSDAAVGQLATLHAALAGGLALLVAPWIDRFPRRTILRLECGILLAATTLTALAPSFGWLFAARALAGIGGAIVAGVCFATVGDLFVDPGRRNRAIATISAAFSISTIAGLPAITEVANLWGWRTAAGMLLVPTSMVVLGTWWLPVATLRERVAPNHGPRYRDAVADWQVNWLLAAVIVLCLVMAGWQLYFGAYTTTVFAISANALSVLFLVAGAGQFVAASVLPFLLRLGTPRSVFTVVTLVAATSLVLVSLIHGAWWLVLPFAPVLSVSTTVLYLTVSVLLMDTRPEARGAVMALQTGCFEIGWALGTAATGGALALLGSYHTVYALLGVVLLASIGFVALSARAHRLPASVEELAAPAGQFGG